MSHACGVSPAEREPRRELFAGADWIPPLLGRFGKILKIRVFSGVNYLDKISFILFKGVMAVPLQRKGLCPLNRDEMVGDCDLDPGQAAGFERATNEKAQPLAAGHEICTSSILPG